ncbi:MAG TPA: hypothetical protein DCP47_00435, partial [Phycisphaerales bacterium]|nr:hypothetical protein [Phycisphaerales bacterium]
MNLKSISLFVLICIISGIVSADITAVNGENKNFTLGSTAAKENPYKLELSLTTKGAAISTAKFRDYNNRDRKNPQPFDFLAPFHNVVSLESRRLMLPAVEKSFPLNKLNWISDGVEKKADGSETISFSAVILQDDYEFLKLTKTFTLRSEDYTIDCNVTVENIGKDEVKVALEMVGPAGITKEDPRTDVRMITAGFINPATGIIEVTKSNVKDTIKEGGKVKMLHKNAEFKFMWVAASDKYFTSIIRPVPTDSNLYSNWIGNSFAMSIDPDPYVKDDENLGVMLETQSATIAAGKEITYKYQIYIGPKDKDAFNTNPLYNKLGFINTIDFQACCWVVGFGWLSFFILDAM